MTVHFEVERIHHDNAEPFSEHYTGCNSHMGRAGGSSPGADGKHSRNGHRSLGSRDSVVDRHALQQGWLSRNRPPAMGMARISFDQIAPGGIDLAAIATALPLSISRMCWYAAARQPIQNIALKMPVEMQQVTVSDQGVGVDTSADNNASSLVIKGKDLDALSDDPDELQSELNALAGPSAGPNGGQIYIDGFTGGQLPPKSSIREIRINQNPFSAQYDKLGYGRIEILTKPGTDKFHGMFMMNGNDSAFNSLNPFVTSEPAYYSTLSSPATRAAH